MYEAIYCKQCGGNLIRGKHDLEISTAYGNVTIHDIKMFKCTNYRCGNKVIVESELRRISYIGTSLVNMLQ